MTNHSYIINNNWPVQEKTQTSPGAMILSLLVQIPTVYLEFLPLLQFPNISGRPIRCSSESQKIKETDALTYKSYI